MLARDTFSLKELFQIPGASGTRPTRIMIKLTGFLGAVHNRHKEGKEGVCLGVTLGHKRFKRSSIQVIQVDLSRYLISETPQENGTTYILFQSKNPENYRPIANLNQF